MDSNCIWREIKKLAIPFFAFLKSHLGLLAFCDIKYDPLPE